jgi:hypothetical protein
MNAARENDPELSELREMMAVWEECFGNDSQTCSQVAKAIDARHQTVMGEPTDFVRPQLREMLIRLFGERGTLNTRRLGNWLSSKEGRLVGKRSFKRDTTSASGGVVKWRVEVT